MSLLVRDPSSYYEDILPFYELETAGRDDLAFWKRVCRRWRPRRVLELGSGLGRVTAVLARNADWVTGIDISIPMLACAHRGPAASRLHLAAADMRRLPFAGAFDLIVAPSDPFSHLTAAEDRRDTLTGVARILGSAGRFVLDGLYLCGHAPLVRRRRLAVPGGTLSIRESWNPIAGRDQWEARYRYRLRTPSESREKSASFVARSWDPGEIVSLFRSCDLAVEELWGSFAGEEFTRQSLRLIVVAAALS
ncbi:MAG: class I SAM-dependent methyltransferase [Thermoanaerobaculia bacterium]